MTKVQLDACLNQASMKFAVDEMYRRLQEEDAARRARCEDLARDYGIAPEDLGKMLTFTPRWSKLHACFDFAVTQPGSRILSEVGRTPTHWVFAIE